MRILESIQAMFRGMRSDGSRLIKFDPAVVAHEPTINVSTTAFIADGRMPVHFSADGEGKFPTIKWSNVPTQAKSLVIVVQDPDAPKPSPFVHAILYNIPPSLTALQGHAVTDDGLTPEALAAGVRFGTNSVGYDLYAAPTPPPKHGPHRYHYQVIALDRTLEFAKPPSLKDIREAIQDRVLAYGEVVGVYERK